MGWPVLGLTYLAPSQSTFEAGLLTGPIALHRLASALVRLRALTPLLGALMLSDFAGRNVVGISPSPRLRLDFPQRGEWRSITLVDSATNWLNLIQA